ncbi:flagellar basal body L-ring protein FlgH [Jannaschia aquimarina]|uniref:Flagellar L-ring protein n=1 Tax=Jannaschia aquimarina TaxID=935700 RepID=A0A0D1EBQ1_9RHOB|nr:flagellar basal body L-ring protein FlgH [Jannaschia aquimarina]KIT14296.1 Flagellar L-ring protein precursor [Jannaschia aquimarina]SNS50275.1 flagellar L-ring protein precursor FlgH [Jannaschia aquimarina]
MIRIVLIAALAVGGCSRLQQVGKAPDLTAVSGGNEHFAMTAGPALPATAELRADDASLWEAGRQSLLGDRRAGRRGDILTVVISIDERAEFANSSSRSRSGSESLSVTDLFGIPQRAADALPEGADLANAVDLNSSSDFGGDGAIRRKERLALRVAATVVEVLPNGVLRIEGTQEVRVNNEVRVLLVTGFVRPEDVTRLNEITYDKIASARISYGGRGQITDVQQPRYGQQVADILLPF